MEQMIDHNEERRQLLLRELARNDRNGCFLDEDCDLEGLPCLSLAQAEALCYIVFNDGHPMNSVQYSEIVTGLFQSLRDFECPLSQYQMDNLHQMGASFRSAFEIGCSIHAGMPADDAFIFHL